MRRRKHVVPSLNLFAELHRTPEQVIPFDSYQSEAAQALDDLATDVRPQVKALGLTDEKVVADLRVIRKASHQAKNVRAKK